MCLGLTASHALSSQYIQPPAMQQAPHAPPPHYQPVPQQYQQPPTQQSSIQIPVGSGLPKVVSTACIYPSQPGQSHTQNIHQTPESLHLPTRNNTDFPTESPDLPPVTERRLKSVILPQARPRPWHLLHFLPSLGLSPTLSRRSQPRPRLPLPPLTDHPGCLTLTLLISLTPLRPPPPL